MKLAPPYDARYVDLARRGSGAQAAVYLGTDATDGGRVALKLLTRLEDESARARVRREARALSTVVHPHLVRFLDLHLDHAPPLLVMEAVAGETLAARLEAGPGEVDPREVGRAIASALGALHAKGILHRDVKLENILDAPGRGPVLVDLGMAAVEGAARLTAEGAVVGTPGYLAPELLAGAGAGPAADVFALGVVLFELLEGKLPFTPLDLAQVARTKALPPEPARRLGDAFGVAVAAALAVDPAARPSASNLELAFGLAPGATQEHLIPGPVAASPGAGARVPADPPRTPGATARPRGARFGLGLSTAVLAGAFVFGLVGLRRDPAPPPTSPAPAAASVPGWPDGPAFRALARSLDVLAQGHRGPGGELLLDRFADGWDTHLREARHDFLDPRFTLAVRGYLRALPAAHAEHVSVLPAGADPYLLWEQIEEDLLFLEHLLLDFDYWDPLKEGLIGEGTSTEELEAKRRVRRELAKLLGDLPAAVPAWPAPEPALLLAARTRLGVVARIGDPEAALEDLLARARAGSPEERAHLLAALLAGLRSAWKRGDLPVPVRVRFLAEAEGATEELADALPPARLQDLRVLALAAELRVLCFGPDAVPAGTLRRADVLLDRLASSPALPGPVAQAHLLDVLGIFEGHHARKYADGAPALARVARVRSTARRLAGSS